MYQFPNLPSALTAMLDQVAVRDRQGPSSLMNEDDMFMIVLETSVEPEPPQACFKSHAMRGIRNGGFISTPAVH